MNPSLTILFTKQKFSSPTVQDELYKSVNNSVYYDKDVFSWINQFCEEIQRINQFQGMNVVIKGDLFAKQFISAEIEATVELNNAINPVFIPQFIKLKSMNKLLFSKNPFYFHGVFHPGMYDPFDVKFDSYWTIDEEITRTSPLDFLRLVLNNLGQDNKVLDDILVCPTSQTTFILKPQKGESVWDSFHLSAPDILIIQRGVTYRRIEQSYGRLYGVDENNVKLTIYEGHLYFESERVSYETLSLYVKLYHTNHMDIVKRNIPNSKDLVYTIQALKVTTSGECTQIAYKANGWTLHPRINGKTYYYPIPVYINASIDNTSSNVIIDFADEENDSTYVFLNKTVGETCKILGVVCPELVKYENYSFTKRLDIYDNRGILIVYGKTSFGDIEFFIDYHRMTGSCMLQENKKDFDYNFSISLEGVPAHTPWKWDSTMYNDVLFMFEN